MTEEQIKAARARCDAATEGPWDFDTEFFNDGPGSNWTVYPEHDDEHQIALVNGKMNGAGDAEFIAHARTDLPRALDEIDRLREELAACIETSGELLDANSKHAVDAHEAAKVICRLGMENDKLRGISPRQIRENLVIRQENVKLHTEAGKLRAQVKAWREAAEAEEEALTRMAHDPNGGMTAVAVDEAARKLAAARALEETDGNETES